MVGACLASRTSAWARMIGQRVGERRRIRHAVLAQLLHLRGQALLAGAGGGGEIQVHVLGQHRDAARQGIVVRLLGLARHVRRRQRQVAGGVAHHRVAGLEAFDALFLRVDGAQVAPHVAGEPVGQIGNAPRGVGQALLEAGHAGDEGGERVEVGQRVRPDAGDLDAPARGELLDLANEIDGGPVAPTAAAAGHGVQGPRRGEQEGGDDDAEDEGAGFHGDSSLDSPASVLMNATIASLSSSGASRPNWNSNMASTASRSVAALPSWR